MPFTDSVKFVKVLMLQTTQITAEPIDVVNGKSFIGSTKELQFGTLPVIEAHGNVTLNAGQNHIVPFGKISQQYTVYAKPLSEQTYGTATAADIIAGKTAWVSGVEITGTIPAIEAEQKTLLCGETYNIASGVHNGNGNVTAASLASQTVGNATSGDMRIGKTAWVNGVQVTGDLLTISDFERVLDAGENYNIARGIHSGGSLLKVKTLAELTSIPESTAIISSDIKSGKSGYANGVLITGTMPLIVAAVHQINLNDSAGYTIPAGYHDGNGRVVCLKEVHGDLNITPTYEQVVYSQVQGKYMTGVVTVAGVDALEYDRVIKTIVPPGTALTFVNGVANYTIPLDNWHDNMTTNIYQIQFNNFTDAGSTINASGECIIVFDYLNPSIKGYKYQNGSSEEVEISVAKNDDNAHVFTFKSTTHTLTSGSISIINPLSLRKYTG